MSQKQTLHMARGDAAGWEFEVTNPRTKARVQLAGAGGLRFTVKRRQADDDDDAITVRTIGDGIEVTDAANGLLEVRLEAAATDSLTRGITYLWDLQLTDAMNRPMTIAEGELVVRLDIGRTVP